MNKTFLHVRNFLNFDLTFIKRELPSIVFILIALVSGLIFMKNTGTLVGPDVHSAHYKAALATATGQVFKSPIDVEYSKRHVIQGNEKYFYSGGKECVKTALVSDLINSPLQSDGKSECVRKHDKHLSSDKTVETGAILQYPFFAYIPQGAALAIGMKTGMEPVYAQTLARLFNLLTYIIIVVMSIRLLARGKWLAVLLASLPPSIFLASSLSADSLNIAWNFLFVSYLIRLYTQKKPVSTKQILIMGVLGVGLFVLKVAYAPLLLLILALRGKIKSIYTGWALFLVTFIVGSLLYIIWSSNWLSLNATVDVGANMRTILHNSPEFIGGIAVNVIHAPVILLEMKEPMYTFIAMAVILLIVHSMRGIKSVSPVRLFDFVYLYRLQILSVLAAVTVLAVTYAALLLTWTDIAKYGFMNIQGFQGRYVLPILPLLLVFYYIPQKNTKK